MACVGRGDSRARSCREERGLACASGSQQHDGSEVRHERPSLYRQLLHSRGRRNCGGGHAARAQLRSQAPLDEVVVFVQDPVRSERGRQRQCFVGPRLPPSCTVARRRGLRLRRLHVSACAQPRRLCVRLSSKLQSTGFGVGAAQRRLRLRLAKSWAASAVRAGRAPLCASSLPVAHHRMPRRTRVGDRDGDGPAVVQCAAPWLQDSSRLAAPAAAAATSARHASCGSASAHARACARSCAHPARTRAQRRRLHERCQTCAALPCARRRLAAAASVTCACADAAGARQEGGESCG